MKPKRTTRKGEFVTWRVSDRIDSATMFYLHPKRNGRDPMWEHTRELHLAGKSCTFPSFRFNS